MWLVARTSTIDRLIDEAWIDDNELESKFLRFFVGAHALGWLTPPFADALSRWPDVFAQTGRIVCFAAALDDRAHADAILARIVSELAADGIITGWRNELYPIGAGLGGDSAPLLHIERAAARAFGITSDAVHVNGVVACEGKPCALWIARRAANKSIDPGMRDNIIGGGVPAGLSVRETLVKEAWEEAGLGAAIASAATPGSRLRIRRIVPEGLQSEVIHVHDLVLPSATIPCNQDGEVGEFERIDIQGLIELLECDRDLIERGPMTLDASLVTLDWLERHGFVTLPESNACRAVYGGADF